MQTSKTIFTHHIYQKHPRQIFKYFRLLVQDPSTITAEPLDLGDGIDFASVLGLKTSSQYSIEFNRESHISKVNCLLPSLNRFLQKQLEIPEPVVCTERLVALFN